MGKLPYRYRLHSSFLLQSGTILLLVLLPALAIARNFILVPTGLVSAGILATAAVRVWGIGMALLLSSLFAPDTDGKEATPCA